MSFATREGTEPSPWELFGDRRPFGTFPANRSGESGPLRGLSAQENSSIQIPFGSWT
jgi:hypothetical protein